MKRLSGKRPVVERCIRGGFLENGIHFEKLDFQGEESGAGIGSWMTCEGPVLASVSPVNGKRIGKIRCAGLNDYEVVIDSATEAFVNWKRVPAPKRGDIVRQIGMALRRYKQELGALISLEVGKIRAEGEGEVQEMIDIADFAVGQSRALWVVHAQ